MDWHSAGKGFKQYLLLEKSLSKNSISAYLHDVKYFENFLKNEILLKFTELPASVPTLFRCLNDTY